MMMLLRLTGAVTDRLLHVVCVVCCSLTSRGSMTLTSPLRQLTTTQSDVQATANGNSHLGIRALDIEHSVSAPPSAVAASYSPSGATARGSLEQHGMNTSASAPSLAAPPAPAGAPAAQHQPAGASSTSGVVDAPAAAPSSPLHPRQQALSTAGSGGLSGQILGSSLGSLGSSFAGMMNGGSMPQVTEIRTPRAPLAQRLALQEGARERRKSERRLSKGAQIAWSTCQIITNQELVLQTVIGSGAYGKVGCHGVAGTSMLNTFAE